MTELKDSILHFITNTNIDNLPRNEDYAILCEKHKGDNIFIATCDKVIKEKTVFEKRVLIQNNAKSMLCESLKILNQRKINNQDEEFELQKFFIDNLVLPKCNQQQNDYYQDMLCNFGNCSIDYFLSFTSRKPNPRENNILHLNYRSFIRFVFQYSKKDFEKELKAAEKENNNLLARAINYLISQKLNGFYYPYHKGDNGDVMSKLTQNCTSAFAFIQLIQDVIFHFDNSRPNYCHFEYKTIQDVIPQERRFFILAENERTDIRAGATIHHEYENWYNEYCENDPVHIPHSITYVQRDLNESKEQIERKIASEIKNMRLRLLDNVPS